MNNILVQKTFENRGFSVADLSDIETLLVGNLMDVDRLADELHTVRMSQERIIVVPDFDMDGIMSGTILFSGLAELGFNVSLYIPNPNSGYGFDESTIDSILEQYPDAKAIISCDVGITCQKGVSYAKKSGLKVFITDHHIEKELLSDADVVVNPKRIEETCAFSDICGAYVAFNCVLYYADKYCDRMAYEQINRLRVFAGVGTVSDSMPLFHDNRQLVRDAVDIVNIIYSNGDDFVVRNMSGCDVYRRAFRGLFAAVKGLWSGKTASIDESFFGYYMAPMFNSVKRLGKDMNLAFGVFFGNTPDECVSALIELNNLRKELVVDYYDKMEPIGVSDIELNCNPIFYSFVLLSEAPVGILGLLAQKKMIETGMPVIVVRKNEDDSYSGSGRSPSWYPLLTQAQGFNLAGHDSAFGAGFDNIVDIANLCKFLADDFFAYYADLKSRGLFTESKPDFTICTYDDSGDVGIDILLFVEYIEEISKYKPFGAGFVSPVISLKFKPSDGYWIPFGSEGVHLRIRFDFGFEAIIWGRGADVEKLQASDICELSGHLYVNEFAGKHTVTFAGDFV